MESVGGYLVSICACAIFCGILTRLLGSKGMLGTTMKVLCGIFMLLTVISPLVHIRLNKLSDISLEFKDDANRVVEQGSQSAKEMMSAIITEQTTAYILDKAQSLNAQLQVDLLLTQEDFPVPCSVKLSGNISPYAKSVLSNWIASNLGIPLEEQTWIT